MDPTVDPRLAGPHLSKLAASIEAASKPLADWRRDVGHIIGRALVLANLSKQEASFAMGYADQSALSRWITAVERPHLDKLFAIDRFYDAWLVACAERNPRIEMETVIRLRRVA